MKIAVYGIEQNEKMVLEEISVDSKNQEILLNIKCDNEFDTFSLNWSNDGITIIDSVEIEEEKGKLSGNGISEIRDYGVERSNIFYFMQKDSELRIQLKKKYSEIHLSFNIRTYTMDEKEYIDAISAECEKENPFSNEYKRKYEVAYKDKYEIEHSSFWKVTEIPRKVVDHVRSGEIPYVSRFYRGITINTNVSSTERKQEQEYTFKNPIKFSILVPLYNTPKRFLKEMIESVIAQTYQNWELCLADASDDAHLEVGEIVQSYCAKDERIKYTHLSKNGGISYNTNECAKMATGEFIALLDHDDLLHPSALFESMKAIDDGADFTYTDEMTFNGTNLKDVLVAHYKSDYAPDTLLANNYICHFSTFKKSLFDEVGGFRDKYNGSQDHDLVLRLTDKANKVVHIPEILYFWRSHNNSTAKNIDSKSYAVEAGQNAVHDYLESKGIHSRVGSTIITKTIYHTFYEIVGNPKISIIIPNKDSYFMLKNCIDSILAKTNYANYEIVIVDNNTTDQMTLHYYEQLKEYENIQVLTFNHPFNYSAINNFAVPSCKGEYLLLLNNDTEVITPSWMREMLMYAQRNDVGAVGAKLIYPNDNIQHAGIIIGTGDDHVASHANIGVSRKAVGYMGKINYVNNYMAVTGACLMVNKAKYEEVNGLDEENFAVAYNDVDFCLKLYDKGYVNVMNPFAELYHFESVSRGSDAEGENNKRFKKEVNAFHKKWDFLIEKGDPYYNKHLSNDALYHYKAK